MSRLGMSATLVLCSGGLEKLSFPRASPQCRGAGRCQILPIGWSNVEKPVNDLPWG